MTNTMTKNSTSTNDKFQFEITEHFGVLSENEKGWRKELNKVSYNGRDPKYDIRDWSPDGSKMAKGVTLNEDEFKELKELILNMDN